MDSLMSWRPDSWHGYLLVYMVPGGLLLAFFLFNKWRERPSEFARELVRIVGKKISPLDRLKEFLFLCVAIACVLLGWPAFLAWLPFGIAQDKRNKAWQALPDFDCAPEYLVAQVNPIDAEIASYVIDPLGTVPSLPFGHLNQGWVNFLADMTDDRDQIWSFYVPQGSKCGKYYRPATSDIRGYAKVRDGKVLGEFITECD